VVIVVGEWGCAFPTSETPNRDYPITGYGTPHWGSQVIGTVTPHGDYPFMGDLTSNRGSTVMQARTPAEVLMLCALVYARNTPLSPYAIFVSMRNRISAYPPPFTRVLIRKAKKISRDCVFPRRNRAGFSSQTIVDFVFPSCLLPQKAHIFPAFAPIVPFPLYANAYICHSWRVTVILHLQ
jgi:hypothetical protein